jgi:hypothetical protein
VKAGTNNVDMTGVEIGRNSLLNFGIAVNNQGKLFTDATGAKAGGTVTISDYYMPNLYSGSARYVERDTLGASLTIAAGGRINIADDEISADATNKDDDIAALYVLPGSTVKVISGGGIQITDAHPETVGRLGIYFEGSTLDSRTNLTLSGPNTFLNGGTGATIRVGANLSVGSSNAVGFTSALTASPVAGTVFDDFDVHATTLTMDGGGTRSFAWTPVGIVTSATLQATDFSITNFAAGSLVVSNNTAVSLASNVVLDLNTDLQIAAGSSINIGDSQVIYVKDADLSELVRLQGYAGTQLAYSGTANGHIEAKGVAGVGIVIKAFPPLKGTAVLIK